jgi:hypothetical protein
MLPLQQCLPFYSAATLCASARPPVKLLQGHRGNEMMLPMRPSHKESTCVFNAKSVSHQKRGNGLLTTSGLLNGIFGDGDDLHVARWESIKVTDRFEETDDAGVVTIRERERFTQSLTLIYSNGTTAVLKEGTNTDAGRAPSNGNAAVHEDHTGHDD